MADLASDFSAIHRIDDMYALDGPVFMQLAFRMPSYQGCMRTRLDLQEQQKTLRQQPEPAGGEWSEDQVERARNQVRVQRDQKALAQGEQPQHVPLEQQLA